MNASRMAELGRWALTWVLVTLGVLALGLGLAQHAGVVGVLEVQGGSMQPAISNGSLLITIPRTTADVRPGDVVSIVGSDHIRVTHRVVDVVDDQVTTRGDANNVADPTPYVSDRLDLVVAHVPFAGVAWRYVSMAAREPVLVGGLVLVIALALPWERLRRQRGRHRADAIELAMTR